MTIEFVVALCSAPFVCSFLAGAEGGFFIERHAYSNYECIVVPESKRDLDMPYTVQRGKCHEHVS